MLDYHRIFGLKTIVFRHSSIFGGRQFATIDQGWIGWFCQKAYEIKHHQSTGPFEIYGNGKQVRDVLFADDLIQCYFKAIQGIEQDPRKLLQHWRRISKQLFITGIVSLFRGQIGDQNGICEHENPGQ